MNRQEKKVTKKKKSNRTKTKFDVWFSFLILQCQKTIFTFWHITPETTMTRKQGEFYELSREAVSFVKNSTSNVGEGHCIRLKRQTDFG